MAAFELERVAGGVPGGVPNDPEPLMGRVAGPEGDILPKLAIKSRMLACLEADVKEERDLGKAGWGNALAPPSEEPLPERKCGELEECCMSLG